MERTTETTTTTTKQKQIILVSNRLPFVVCRDPETGKQRRSSCAAGGLITALMPLITRSNAYWVGWAEGLEPADESGANQIPAGTNPKSLDFYLKSKNIVPIFYDANTFNLFYNGMCNASLWPLMHSLTTIATFKDACWQSYTEVNRRFTAATADKLRHIHTNGFTDHHELVWIHDYHLMTMPMMLRRVLDEWTTKCQFLIAFFLHIPFPSWDIFRLNPWAKELLSGLLGANLVAFHTPTYAVNFMESCERLIVGARRSSVDTLEYEGRHVAVRALPIGVAYDWFEAMARLAPPQRALQCSPAAAAAALPQQRVILGVDRLDYTKGILQRVHGYERFLDKYPQHREKVVLFQIAVPSRTDVHDYKSLKDELEREIGRISGRFGTSHWTPIKYMYKNVAQHELAGFYRDAHVALVTPIRDGMNLVAKEFVACQTSDDPGVLIISPFSGAGESMLEALSVNPLEENLVADAIDAALTMSLEERTRRMRALQSRERHFCLDKWLDSFIGECDALIAASLGGDSTSSDTTSEPSEPSDTSEDVDDAAPTDLATTTTTTTSGLLPWSDFLAQEDDDQNDDHEHKQQQLVLILDYDGTLVPIQPHPDMAKLSEAMTDVLAKLAQQPGVDLCILSGRSLANLRQMIGSIGDRLNLSGSHGMETYLASTGGTQCVERFESVKARVAGLAHELRSHVCVYGGWVEEKVYHVAFHYRETARAYREAMCERAGKIMRQHGFDVQAGHMLVEARPAVDWDKGKGVFDLLDKLHAGRDGQEGGAAAEQVCFVGDDETDEDAMRALSGRGVTFRVAPAHANVNTSATYRLETPEHVRLLLEWILKRVDGGATATQPRQSTQKPHI